MGSDEEITALEDKADAESRMLDLVATLNWPDNTYATLTEYDVADEVIYEDEDPSPQRIQFSNLKPSTNYELKISYEALDLDATKGKRCHFSFKLNIDPEDENLYQESIAEMGYELDISDAIPSCDFSI